MATAFVAACGGSNGTETAIRTPPGASALSTVQPSVSPTPATRCSKSNRCLALVTLRPGNQIAVRDITDIAHPKTVAMPVTGALPRFVSGTTLSSQNWVEVGLPTELYRSDLTGSPETRVLSADQGIVHYAWSPDGTSLAYVTLGRSSLELRLKRAGVDRVVGLLPDLGEPDFAIAYSPDGAHLAVVANVASGFLRMWDANGANLRTYNGSAATMPVWLGDSLYFRDSKGVEVWRNGAISTFLPGLDWILPHASPGGGVIVYETRDTKGVGHVLVVDAATRQIRELAGGRGTPVFLTSRYVWYGFEAACPAGAECVAPFGTTYIYDLQTGTEHTSIITNVFDVWPHAA